MDENNLIYYFSKQLVQAVQKKILVSPGDSKARGMLVLIRRRFFFWMLWCGVDAVLELLAVACAAWFWILMDLKT